MLAEVGTLLAELRRRRGRSVARLERAADVARDALAAGDGASALRAVRSVGFNPAMDEALTAIVEQRDKPDAANRIAKRLAEYDYRSVRRLERTRILVRMGPALGLMGTLIPLSPALAGLADGDVQRLTDDLRVAFSVTVAGLLIGAVAYTVSLVRDRLYDQDYSDVEYMAAALAPTSRRHRAASRTGAGAPPTIHAPPGGDRPVSRPTVSARARSREDRAGDPLDGLVNLFDLGIVLSVAFLLAALSSLKLGPEALGRDRGAATGRGAPLGSVIAPRDARVRSVQLRPGQRVVGQGRAIGTVYRLDDGRTIVVRKR